MSLLYRVSVLYKKKKKKNTYLAFLDLWKAFERVWREGLFYLLWQNGIQGKCWRLLWSLYKKVNNRVLFGNYESDWFSQDYGVKQRCVFHPTLFSIPMNDLVSMLDKAGVGVQVSNQLINSLLFADDITWIANSEQELNTLLDIKSKFADKWNLKFTTLNLK